VQTVRIGADEDIDDMKGLKPEEISERIQHKEAKAHAQILEMVSSNVNSLTYFSRPMVPFIIMWRVNLWTCFLLIL